MSRKESLGQKTRANDRIACPEGTPENVVLEMIDFLGIPESALREAGAGHRESSSPTHKTNLTLPED